MYGFVFVCCLFASLKVLGFEYVSKSYPSSVVPSYPRGSPGGGRCSFFSSALWNNNKSDECTWMNESFCSMQSDVGPSNVVMSRRLALRVAAATLATTTTSSQRTNAISIITATHNNQQKSPAKTSAAATAASSFEESLTGFVAGAALAATKTVVKFPLDTATVRLQLPSRQYTIRNLPELFDGSFNGISTTLIGNIPGSAVFFAVRDACKAGLKANAMTESWAPWIHTCLAVAVAQFPYWLVRNPSEVVKTRQQAKIPGYDDGVSMIQGYNQVWIDALQQKPQPCPDIANATVSTSQQLHTTPTLNLPNLVDAFYLGYWENILYAYPADAIKFLVYDQWTRKPGGKSNLSPAQGAVAGAVSTAMAQLVTTPLDVVRNRLMTNAAAASTKSTTIAPTTSSAVQERAPPTIAQSPLAEVVNVNSLVDVDLVTPFHRPSKASYWDTLRNLAETEGLPGLFAGAAPRVGKAIISGAIQFATYEETKSDIAKLLRK